MAQETSALWKSLLALPGTLREYKFLIDGVEYVKAEGTDRGEISHSVTQSLFDKFSIGNASAAQLNLTILADDIPRGEEIRRYVRLYNADTGEASEWLPKGVFWPNRRPEDDGIWSIEAFDAIRKADVPWDPPQSLNFPLSARTAVEIFAQQIGAEVDPRTYDAMSGADYTIDYPTTDPENESGENYTIRHLLCAIAAAYGGNFVMSDEGKLRLIPALSFRQSGADSHTLGLDLVTDQDGKTLPAVSRVTFSVDSEHVYSAGADGGLELTADVSGLTQDSAEAAVTRVLTSLIGYEYQMYTAEAAGLDPAAEIGDAVSVGGTDSGVTSALISSVLASVSDAGSGYPDIAAPGEAENPDEMPAAGPVSSAFAQQLAQTKSYILKTTDAIILGVRNDFTQQFSEIRIDVDSIEAEVNDPEKGLDALFEILSNRITLSVSESTSTTSRYADITLTVDGTEHGHGRILITGNVNVSGELSAEALYAAQGDIANLIVDELKTSRRITKYLNRDTTDDDYIYIHGETQQFISGEYTNATPVQALNPFGAPLFWEDNPDGEGVYIGNDGYPHRADSTRIFTQVDTSPYPVMVYVYNDVVKTELAFTTQTDAQGNTIKVPTLVMGAGNAAGTNQARIWKDTDGLHIMYTPNNTEQGEPQEDIGIVMKNDGVMELHGYNPVELVAELPAVLTPGKFYAIADEEN